MFGAKRAITRAGGNVGLILGPVECEGYVSAVAFSDDEHVMSVGGLVIP